MRVSIARLLDVIVISVEFQGGVVKHREQDPMPIFWYRHNCLREHFSTSMRKKPILFI